MIIFYETISIWYSIVTQIEKAAMIEMFKEVKAFVKQKLISKIKAFL